MQLSWKRIDLRLTHPWGTARRQNITSSNAIIIQLEEAGILGRGEASPRDQYNESIHTVESFFRNIESERLSFADFEGSVKYIESLSIADRSAKSALNIALLDGAASRLGKAVYDFLELGFREEHYYTSYSIGIDTPKYLVSKVIEANNFPILKLKVGTEYDLLNLRALREAAPNKLVRMDANEGWKTKEEAVRKIEELAHDGFIQFIEQPLSATAPIADWQWLKQRSSLPIFADESYHLAADAERCAECFHGVNVKLSKAGGITAARDALIAARKVGLKTMLGCMIETSLAISAAAHLAELCDYLDLDGNLLIANDPFVGVTAENGILSFAKAREKFGLRLSPR